MNELPQIGDGVTLVDVGRFSYASRIEGTDPGMLTVARPIGLPAASPYEPGAQFDLSWVGGAGINVVPVELVESRREGAVPLWDVAVVGNTRVEQRREFVRVPVFGRITVLTGLDDDGGDDGAVLDDPHSPASGDDERTVRGVLVDLSEAALQCTLWTPGTDERIAEGSRVLCRFTIFDDEVRRAGSVLRIRPGPPGAKDNQCNVVVTFEQSTAEADALRRHVFAIQLQMRRAEKERGGQASTRR